MVVESARPNNQCVKERSNKEKPRQENTAATRNAWESAVEEEWKKVSRPILDGGQGKAAQNKLVLLAGRGTTKHPQRGVRKARMTEARRTRREQQQHARVQSRREMAGKTEVKDRPGHALSLEKVSEQQGPKDVRARGHKPVGGREEVDRADETAVYPGAKESVHQATPPECWKGEGANSRRHPGAKESVHQATPPPKSVRH